MKKVSIWLPDDVYAYYRALARAIGDGETVEKILQSKAEHGAREGRDIELRIADAKASAHA